MTEISTSNQQTTALTSPANVVQPLALRAMFWRPNYLEVSAWLENIPFAYWVIEAQRPKVFVELGTHHGTSYFSFCQAVERLEVDTQCYAVDTWKGDEHTGPYDEKVLQKVRAYNDAHYAGFSRLICSSFDDALDRFADGSIDLLHVDGLPTFDATRNILDRWLPKMSERGVIILHNTNERAKDFGVFKLFEKLLAEYPAFEFMHEHGLGVLGVGPKQVNLLQHLFEANKNEAAKRAIQEVFSRLGRACADSYKALQQQERANKLGEEVSKQKKLLDDVKQSLEKTKDDVAARARDLSDARAKLQAQSDQHAMEKGQLTERASLLQELRGEMKGDVNRLQDAVQKLSTELHHRAADVARLERLNQATEHQHAVVIKTQAESDARIAALQSQRDKLQADVKAFQARAEKREQDIALAQTNHKALAEQNEARGKKLQQRDAKIAELTEKELGNAAQLDALQAKLQQVEQALALAGEAETARAQHVAELADKHAEQEKHLAGLSNERSAHLASLEQQRILLATRDQELAQARAETAAGVVQIASLTDAMAKEGQATAAVKEALAASRAHAQVVDAKLAKRDEDAAKLGNEVQARDKQLQVLKAELQTAASEVSALSARNETVSTELASTKAMHDEQKRALLQVKIDFEARGKKIQQRDAKIAELVEKNGAQSGQLEAATAKLQELEQALASTREEARMRNDEVAALMEKQAQQVQHIADLTAKTEAHVDSLAQADNLLAERTRELEKAHRATDAGMEQLEAMTKELADSIRRTTSLEELAAASRAGMLDVEARLARRDAEFSALQQEAHSGEAGIAQLKDELHAVQGEKNVLLEDAEKSKAQLATLQAALEEGAHNLETVQSKLQVAETALQEAKLGEADLAKLRDDLHALQDDRHALLADAEQAKAQMARMQASMEEGARDLDSTRKKLQQVETELAAAAQAQGLLAEQEQEVARLRQAAQLDAQQLATRTHELAETAQRAALLQSTLESVRLQGDTANSTLGTTQALLEQRKRELAQSQDDIAKLRDETSALREQMKAKERQASQLRTQADVAEAKTQQLTKRLAEQTSRQSSYKLELEQLQLAHASLRSERESLATTVADRFKEVALITETLKSVQRDRSIDKAAIAELTTRAENAEKAFALAATKSEEELQRQASHKAQLHQIALEKATLQMERDELMANVEERFRELAKMSQLLEAAETAREQFVLSEQTKVHTDVLALQEALAAAQAAQLRAEQDLATVLSKKDAQIQVLAQKMAISAAQHTADLDKKPGQFRVFAALNSGGNNKNAGKLSKQMHLLRQSGLFDESWYLSRYPDVAESNFDPVEHFLNFGAAEARDPGPFFNTEAYIASNPDVVESGINPLLHYINHGSVEGRGIENAKDA